MRHQTTNPLNFFAALAFFLCACVSTPASAALLELGGREWQQLRDFKGASWNHISAVCDPATGACSGSLGNIALDGWTWAGVDDVNHLFNDYFKDSPGCCQTWEEFGPGPDLLTRFPARFFGSRWRSTGFVPLYEEIFLDIFGFPMTAFTIWSGWLRDEVPGAPEYGPLAGIIIYNAYDADLNDRIFTSGRDLRSQSDERVGGWFYRNLAAAVPVPASGLLVLLGLFCVWFTRRERAPSLQT